MARLRELVLDLGEAVTALTGRVGSLAGRMDAIDEGFRIFAAGVDSIHGDESEPALDAPTLWGDPASVRAQDRRRRDEASGRLAIEGCAR